MSRTQLLLGLRTAFLLVRYKADLVDVLLADGIDRLNDGPVVHLDAALDIDDALIGRLVLHHRLDLFTQCGERERVLTDIKVVIVRDRDDHGRVLCDIGILFRRVHVSRDSSP